MKKTFFKHIMESRKKIALLLLLSYAFSGALIADGLVLCVSTDGRIAIELNEKEFNVGNQNFCSMSDDETDLSAIYGNPRNMGFHYIGDSQSDCCEHCEDIDVSMSEVASISKTASDVALQKTSPPANGSYAVLSISTLTFSPINRFIRHPIEYSRGVNSTLYSLSTVVLLS